MKNSKKGSVMPIVIIGLMMVSVIAFIFLSAVLYGNTEYQTSADELDEKLILDEIGNKFLKGGKEYADFIEEYSKHSGENVGAVPYEDTDYSPKAYNVIVSYDKTTLIVKDKTMTQTLLTVVVGENEDGSRFVRVWTYGAYRGDV